MQGFLCYANALPASLSPLYSTRFLHYPQTGQFCSFPIVYLRISNVWLKEIDKYWYFFFISKTFHNHVRKNGREIVSTVINLMPLKETDVSHSKRNITE